MKKNFIINSIIIIVSSLIVKTLSASFDIFLANKIGAEAIGTYSLIMSIYILAVTVATSGINLATTKMVSEELEKKCLGNIPKVVKHAITYSVIMGSVSAILLGVFSKYICAYWLMGKVSYQVLLLLVISLPFLSVSSVISGYFLAMENALKPSKTQVVDQIIRIITIWVLLIFVFPNTINYSILALVLGSTVSQILSCLVLLLQYLNDKKRLKPLNESNVKIARRIFKISIPIAITSYIRSGLHTLKHILIPIRLKLSGMSYNMALAHYGIITGMALHIVLFPSLIVYSYSSLLVPEFSKYAISKNKTNMQNDINKIFKVTLYFCICITGLLMTYGKDIGNIFFNENGVGWYIKIMAPLIPLIYLDNVVDNILKGLGKQVSVMCCNILDLIVYVSFIYYLLPMFGPTGYIIVMYISETINYIISVLTLFKVTDVKFRYTEWIIIPVIVIIISIIFAKLIPIYLSHILTVFLKIFISILVYTLLLKYINTKKCS